jgi:hypothetical protein
MRRLWRLLHLADVEHVLAAESCSETGERTRRNTRIREISKP